MTRLGTRVAIAVLALVLALACTTAFAAYKNTPAGALRDCGAGHDPLKGHYTVHVLQQALQGLSTSNAEYSTCATALANAIRALERPPVKRHPTGGSSGGGTKTTTTETQTSSTSTTTSTSTDSGTTDPITGQIHAAFQEGRKPLSIDGQTVTPGATVTRGSSFPTALIIALAALAAVLAAVGGLKARSIVRARRTP